MSQKAQYELLHNDIIFSRLSWLVQNSSMFSVSFGWKPEKLKRRFTLQAMLDFNISEKAGTKRIMDDYDWDRGYTSGAHWDMHSYHAKVLFRYINVDVFGKYDVLIFGNPNNKYGKFTIGTLIGFKYNFMQFHQAGMGGHYDYPEEMGGIHDISYSYDKSNGIRFTTNIYLPYYGLYVSYQYKRLSLLGTFRNSFLNLISIEDRHMYDGVTGKGGIAKISKMLYYDVSLNIGYTLTEHIKLFTDFTFMQILYNVSSESNYSNYEYDQNIGNDDNSKMSYKSYGYMIKLGLIYAF